MLNRTPMIALTAVGWLALTACTPAPMRVSDAVDALAQASRSDLGNETTQPTVEISTDFTIGAALEAAAQELRDFWASQAPCAAVGVAGAVLTVDYGALEDDCVWRGDTVQGMAEIELISAASSGLEVEHRWFGLGNSQVVVDGEARVTWTDRTSSYRVDTTHAFTEADGATTDVQGVTEVRYLDPGRDLLGGFGLEGTRAWSNETGSWDLAITEVEARLIDPVPYAGSWLLTDPEGRTLELIFGQLDDNTFSIELIGLRDPVTLHVGRLGQVDVVE